MGKRFLPACSWCSHLIMSGAFVWIYSRGVDAAPWAGQGMRFGVAVSRRCIASPSRACAKRRPDHCGMHIATIAAP